MIAYDLKCGKGHEFEAWFKNGKTFERQKREGLIECPCCGSSKVSMVYRPQALGGTARRSRGRNTPIGVLSESKT